MTKVLSGKDLDQAAIDAAIARSPFNAHEKSSVAIQRSVMALMYKDGYKASEAAHADYRALEERNDFLVSRLDRMAEHNVKLGEELASLRARVGDVENGEREMTRSQPSQLRTMADDYDLSAADYGFDIRISNALRQAADDCEDAERYRYIKVMKILSGDNPDEWIDTARTPKEQTK